MLMGPGDQCTDIDFHFLDCHNIEKGGDCMRCEFNDGLKVSYAGPLRINKGAEVNVYLSADEIPTDIHGELHEAARRESCNALRQVAMEVTDIVGRFVPERQS